MSSPTQLSFDSQLLLEWLDVPACILSLPDRVIKFNGAFATLCRANDSSLQESSLICLLPEINVRELNIRLAQNNTPASLAVQFRDRESTRSMLLKIMPLTDPELRLIAFAPMETNAAQSSIQSKQTLLEYQALLNNAPFGVVYSKDRQIVRYNKVFGDLFGFSGNSGLGQPTSTLYPSETAHTALSKRAFPELVNAKPFREELLMRRQDGGVFWADAVAYLIAPCDPLQGSIWIINDISERKIVEAALNDALLETQAIIENASVALVFTRNRQIQRCNRRTEEIFGYAPGELLGKQAIILYATEESYGLIGRQAGPLLQAGKAFLAEWQYKRKDGTLFWTRAYAKAVDPNDTNRGTVWMLEDITSAKATQDALKQSLNEMEALMRNASVGILITEARRMVHYNQRFAEMFGYENDAGIGQPASLLFRSDEEYAAVGLQAGPLLSTAKPFQTELFMRRRDGSDVWTNLIGYVADPNDTSRGTFWILEDRSAYKEAEEALQHAYAEQQLIFEHSVVGIAFIKNRIIQRCNRRFEELYGFEPGALIGQSTRQTYLTEKAHLALGEAAYQALGRGETFIGEIIHRRRDGEPFWIRITGKAIDPAFPNAGSIWNSEDITARKVAENSLRESEMLQRAILDSASLMILSTDSQGHIISCNPASEQMLGLKRHELLGRPVTECFFVAEELAQARQAISAELGMPLPTDSDVLLAKPRLGSVTQGEWTFRRASGDLFSVELSVSSLHQEDGGKQGFLLVASDITERKEAKEALLRSRNELEIRVKERTVELEGEVNERRRAESRLRYLALHDPLTSLPNRNLLQKRIREALLHAHDNEQQVAIFFIDLDRFKTINDSLGHHIGDALLKKVAVRLRTAMRSDDTVARIGGDEFVIILPLTDGHERAASIAENILEALRPSFAIDGHELFVTPSIGICLFPRDGTSVDALMRNADTAMYQAKAAGRNNFQFFQAEMNANADNFFQIESSLRQAIERNEFEVYFQPIIDLQTTRPAAFEALVRWRHPSKGLLAPGNFISVAEESGLIGRIGSLVTRAVCHQLRNWIDAGYQPPRIAINLSPIQFRDPDLIPGIARTLDEFGLTPDHIELEITETALMQDGELTLSTLEELKNLGFHLSIDDFGTGYSSLAYLKRFPVDTLKIDRSFITDMTTDDDDRAIVTAVLALAKSLRLSVIAEGVETEAQLAALSELGCDQIQGYLISRPLSAANIRDLCFGEQAEKLRCGTR